MFPKNYLALLALGAALLLPMPSISAEAAKPRVQAPVTTADPQADILAAEKRFEQVEKEFAKAEAANPSQNATAPKIQPLKATPTQTKRPSQPRTGQRPAQSASTTQRRTGTAASQAMRGSPETGWAGTWTDPATGDIVTSVIAPTPPAANQQQTYPIIIEPQIASSNWGSSSSSWNGSAWPQWPGYGGDNGYPLPAPPPPPSQNPGFNPGAWQPSGQIPGYAPNNPTPPFPPGYRPLRPNSPSVGWNNGQGGIPGQPGFPNQPGMPNQPGIPNQPNPAMQPHSNNPGWAPSFDKAPPNAWQPNQPGTPGWVPPSFDKAPPNAWQPKPNSMRPGGNWQGRPMPARPGGNSWGTTNWGFRPGGGR